MLRHVLSPRQLCHSLVRVTDCCSHCTFLTWKSVHYLSNLCLFVSVCLSVCLSLSLSLSLDCLCIQNAPPPSNPSPTYLFDMGRRPNSINHSFVRSFSLSLSLSRIRGPVMAARSVERSQRNLLKAHVLRRKSRPLVATSIES